MVEIAGREKGAAIADKTNPIPLDNGQLDEVAGGNGGEGSISHRYECRDCGTVFIAEENRAGVEASGRKCPFCGLTMEYIGIVKW